MMSYLVHEPLLGPDFLVLGYRISLQQNGTEMPDDADLEAVLSLIAGTLVSSDKFWLLGDKQLFLEVTPSLLATDSLNALSSEKTVLSVDGIYLEDAGIRAAITELRKRGFGISLRNLNPISVNEELRPHITHMEVDCIHADSDGAA